MQDDSRDTGAPTASEAAQSRAQYASDMTQLQLLQYPKSATRASASELDKDVELSRAR
jgi:hypothetical protein